MCVAIYLPKETALAESILKDCHTANPHSIGYMFVQKSKIVIRKFLKWEDFLPVYHVDHAAHGATKDFVIHFRIATSGKIDLDNCHPFEVTSNTAMVHNGIISCTPGDAELNDTRKFCEAIAPLLSKEGVWEHKFFWTMILETIGTYNKLVFMRADGSIKIVGESKGTWKEGVWFSNMSWDRTPVVVHSYGNYPKSYSPNKCATCAWGQAWPPETDCYRCRQEASHNHPLTIARDTNPTYLLYAHPADIAYFCGTKKWTRNRKSAFWSYMGNHHVILPSKGVKMLSRKNPITDMIDRRVEWAKVGGGKTSGCPALCKCDLHK